MVSPSLRLRRVSARLAVVVLAGSACGRAGADCIALPCPLPQALEITVTAGGVPALGASISVAGPFTGGGWCSGAVCHVLGTAGKYDVDVSAPGYQTVHRRVVVQGDSPDCGCPTVETQRLIVALPTAG